MEPGGSMFPKVGGYNNGLLDCMDVGGVDFKIEENGRLQLIPWDKKFNKQREKDKKLLQLAVNKLNAYPVGVESRENVNKAEKVIRNLREEFDNSDEISKFLKNIIGIETDLENPESHRRTISPERGYIDVHRESKEKAKEKKKAKRSRSNESPRMKGKERVEEHPLRRSRSATDIGDQPIENLLAISTSYPEQPTKGPKISPKLLKPEDIKNLQEKVDENYEVFGNRKIETFLKGEVMRVFNDPTVSTRIAADFLRYLPKKRIKFEKTDQPDKKFLTKSIGISTKEEEDAYRKIAYSFVEYVKLITEALPDGIFVGEGSVSDRKAELTRILTDKIMDAKNETDLEGRIQKFMEESIAGENEPEFQYIARILKNNSQGGIVGIGLYILQAGPSNEMKLEQLPSKMNMLHDVDNNKLYLCYKLKFIKKPDPKRKAIVNDSMPFVIDSKIVFSIDLNDRDNKWNYEGQKLRIGVSDNKRKTEKNAKALFNTFSILGFNPEKEYFVCPPKVTKDLL